MRCSIRTFGLILLLKIHICRGVIESLLCFLFLFIFPIMFLICWCFFFNLLLCCFFFWLAVMFFFILLFCFALTRDCTLQSNSYWFLVQRLVAQNWGGQKCHTRNQRLFNATVYCTCYNQVFILLFLLCVSLLVCSIEHIVNNVGVKYHYSIQYCMYMCIEMD